MKLVGKATIKKNGVKLRTVPGAKLDMGGEVRKPVVHDDGTVGHSSSFKEAMLECETTLAKGERLSELHFEEATVTFEADTGQVFVLSNAFTLDPPVLTAQEGGKVPLKISAERIEEM